MQYLPWFTAFFMALRNMRSRLTRSFLTVLGISLGVAVVLAIDITNESTLNSLAGMFERAVGKSELQVVPLGDEETFSLDLLPVVQKTTGVHAAAPSISQMTLMVDDPNNAEAYWVPGGLEVGRLFELRGIDPESDQQVRIYNLVEGRFPVNSRYEALTTQKYADDKGLIIGDDLSLLTPTGVVELQIVGLLSSEGAGLLNDGLVGFTPLNVLQDIFDLGDEIQEIAVQVDPGIGSDPRALADLKSKLEKRLGDGGRVIYPAARGDLVPRMLDNYQTGLFFFSIIAIFVGSFLIYNTFSMTVVERTQEIGMLRAIGMERGQIISLVLTEAGILSVIGSLVGVIFGVFLARGLLALLSGLLTTGENLLSVTRGALIKSVGIGLLITLVAAIIPAIQAAQVSPLEALQVRSRTSKPVRALVWVSGLVFIFTGWAFLYRLSWRPEVVFVANMIGFILFMFGGVLTVPLCVNVFERLIRVLVVLIYRQEGVIGVANVRRSVMRTTLTVACLMIAMVMIIGIGSLAQTFKNDISSWVNNALGGDLYVSPANTMHASFSGQLAEIQGVRIVSPTRFLNVKINPASLSFPEQEDTLVLTAIDPSTFLQIGDMIFTTGQGNPGENWAKLSRGESVFISSVVADEYNLKQGDSLVLQTRRGSQPFEVAAVVTDFTGQGLVITTTYADLKRWFSETGADRFSIASLPGYDSNLIKDEIIQRFKDRYGIEVQSTQTLKDSVIGFLDQTFRLFDVLSMIGMIIGGLGVLNTLTMNVLERTQELGGLRSLGMTRGQMVRMVLAEALAMALIGCIYGITFGYLISQVFVFASTTLTGYELNYVVTFRPYGLALLVVFLVSQVAAASPARRAAKVNIIEALKHE